jgi:rSAM/selenodomain-associated transferase 2
LNISVIIPVLNEDSRVSASITKAWRCGADEVVVVDGGSTDRTVEIAESEDCIVVNSPPGRGVQLNAGARRCSGDVLLFLHVDNWMESGAVDQIRSAMLTPNCIGGGFHQKIDNPKTVFRLIEMGNFLRAKYQRLIYGDQGLFVRRSEFEAVGGFPEIPLMEDFQFSQTLFRRSQKPVLLAGPIHVSPRRWEKNGVVKQTISNWKIAYAYRRGASPEELYRRYYRN